MHQSMKMEAACHCGAVCFRLKYRMALNREAMYLLVLSGAVAVSAEAGDISFDRGEEALTVYRFNTGVAEHYFRSRCGLYTHHRRRSNPNQVGVNAACLKSVRPFDFDEVPVFDGIAHPNDGNYRIVGYLRFVPSEPASD